MADLTYAGIAHRVRAASHADKCRRMLKRKLLDAAEACERRPLHVIRRHMERAACILIDIPEDKP